MDIKLPAITTPQLTVPVKAAGGIELKLGQILEAKVIETGTMLNSLKLSVADKTWLMQGKQPLNLSGGEALTLQVVKLLPAPEFKIVPQQSTAAQQATPNNNQTLILVGQSQSSPSSEFLTTASLVKLIGSHPADAVVTALADNKVTLQVALPPNRAPGTRDQPATVLLTLDSKQLKLSPSFGASGFTVNSSGPTVAGTSLAMTSALQPGQALVLQTVKDSNPPLFSAIAPTVDRETILSETQKQLLPIQLSSTPLLQQLQNVLDTNNPDSTVAETLKRLAQEILASIPSRNELGDSAHLKKAVDNSGLFLESKLAALLSGKAETLLKGDFKLKLGKLVETLLNRLGDGNQTNAGDAETLKESLKKAEGLLAKLTLDQIKSLPQDDSPKQSWILELPFVERQQAHSVQIEIEQDKAGDSESEQKNWLVSITITPPELATIHCKISRYDGSINTRFWSEGAATIEKINAHLDYLKQQLEQKGLTIGFMEAYQGKPANKEAGNKPLTQLLSVKA